MDLQPKYANTTNALISTLTKMSELPSALAPFVEYINSDEGKLRDGIDATLHADADGKLTVKALGFTLVAAPRIVQVKYDYGYEWAFYSEDDKEKQTPVWIVYMNPTGFCTEKSDFTGELGSYKEQHNRVSEAIARSALIGAFNSGLLSPKQ